MRIFFDTSVLVAASERAHPHWVQAKPALLRVVNGEDAGFASLHSLAEVYAALTRLPVQPRIDASQALHIIRDNILPHFEFIPIEKADYIASLQTVAGSGWGGAKIYDALLLQCAQKCGAERIYTFNLGDFRELAPLGLRDRIGAP